MKYGTSMGPGRPVIISDPAKLDYFAQANAVRAGVFNTWGALSGFGDTTDDGTSDGPQNSVSPSSLAYDAPVIPATGVATTNGNGWLSDPSATAFANSGSGVSLPPTPPLVQGNANSIAQPAGGYSSPPLVSATTGQVMTPGGGSTLSNFFSSLNNLISPAPTLSPYAQSLSPSPLPWIIGIGVLGVGAIVLLRHKDGGKKSRA